MEQSSDPWVVVAVVGEDRVSFCTCCGAIRIEFGNMRVQISLEDLMRIARLARRMSRDMTTEPADRDAAARRDISISFGRQRFALRLSMGELGRLRAMLDAAWRRLYLSGNASWPDNPVN